MIEMSPNAPPQASHWHTGCRSLIRHLGKNKVGRNQKNRQAYAVKGGLFTLLADCGRREEEKGGKRRKGGASGRVGEEQYRAGGEGECEDSCADNHALLAFI